MTTLNQQGKRTAPPAVFPSAETKKLHRDPPVYLPNAARNLIDSLTEEHDLAAALALLTGLLTPESAPDNALIRQLFALALDPLSFPLSTSLPTQDSRTQDEKAKDPTAASVANYRRVAMGLLRDIIETNGTKLVEKALPGYAPSAAFDSLLIPPPISQSSAKTTTLRERKIPIIPPPNPALEYKIEADDSPLVQAGKRLGKSLDIWSVLGGKGLKGGRVWSAATPVVEGGWEVLEVLVGLWEIEARDREEAGQSSISPSLLRQFATTPSGPRIISNQVLSIIFWPFRLHSSASSEDSSSPVDSSGHRVDGGMKADGEGRTEFEKAIGWDLERGEKCAIAGRLMGLLGNLAAYSHFVGAQSIQDVTTWMKDLDVDGISEFLDRISLTSPLLTHRLLVHYLETFSHLPPSSTALPSINISPSRGGRLAATTSTTSLLSNGSSQSQSHLSPLPPPQPNTTPTAYFTPSLRPTTLSLLLAKIPRQIPLDASGKTGELSSRKTDFRGKKEIILEVGEVYEIVKEAFCACVLALEEEGIRKKEEEMRKGGEARRGIAGAGGGAEGLLEVLKRDGGRRRVTLLVEEALERAT